MGFCVSRIDRSVVVFQHTGVVVVGHRFVEFQDKGKSACRFGYVVPVLKILGNRLDRLGFSYFVQCESKTNLKVVS